MTSKAASVRFSLRISPALHGELTYIAEQLGIDLGNTISMILNEHIGEYSDRARAIARRRAARTNTKEQSSHAKKPKAARPK